MALSYTYHGDRFAESVNNSGATLRPQSGVAVDVSDGAASGALAKSGLYRVAAKTASLVVFDPTGAATDGSNGEYWPADRVETRQLAAGTKIGCSASA